MPFFHISSRRRSLCFKQFQVRVVFRRKQKRIIEKWKNITWNRIFCNKTCLKELVYGTISSLMFDRGSHILMSIFFSNFSSISVDFHLIHHPLNCNFSQKIQVIESLLVLPLIKFVQWYKFLCQRRVFPTRQYSTMKANLSLNVEYCFLRLLHS